MNMGHRLIFDCRQFCIEIRTENFKNGPNGEKLKIPAKNYEIL